MNRPSWVIWNFVVFLFIFWIFAAFQSSVIHWLLGWHATPQLTIILLTFIALHRRSTEGYLFTFLACYSSGVMSTVLESVNVFAGTCIFLALTAARKQVYQGSPVHFTWSVMAAVFGYHLVMWMTNGIFDSVIPNFFVLDVVSEVLMTALLARVFLAFFIWVDRRTKRVAVGELEL